MSDKKTCRYCGNAGVNDVYCYEMNMAVDVDYGCDKFKPKKPTEDPMLGVARKVVEFQGYGSTCDFWTRMFDDFKCSVRKGGKGVNCGSNACKEFMAQWLAKKLGEENE